MGIPINRKITQSGSGVSDWIPLNRYAADDISLVVDVTGTVTYTVEMTLDRINRAGVTADSIISHGTLVSKTTDESGNVDFPVEAVRINITAGDGSAELHVMQGSS